MAELTVWAVCASAAALFLLFKLRHFKRGLYEFTGHLEQWFDDIIMEKELGQAEKEEDTLENKIYEKLKAPFTYTIIAAFAIFCSCLCITVSQFAIKETYSEKTEHVGVSPQLDSETIIHQEINVRGNITELELKTEGISEGDHGNIKILLKHSKGNWTENFSLDSILKNGQNISIKLPSNIVGPIDVYVSGVDLVNPVVLKTRSENLLGQYDINGTIYSGNVLMTVKTTVIPRYIYLRISLLIIMLFILNLILL